MFIGHFICPIQGFLVRPAWWQCQRGYRRGIDCPLDTQLARGLQNVNCPLDIYPRPKGGVSGAKGYLQPCQMNNGARLMRLGLSLQRGKISYIASLPGQLCCPFLAHNKASPAPVFGEIHCHNLHARSVQNSDHPCPDTAPCPGNHYRAIKSVFIDKEFIY